MVLQSTTPPTILIPPNNIGSPKSKIISTFKPNQNKVSFLKENGSFYYGEEKRKQFANKSSPTHKFKNKSKRVHTNFFSKNKELQKIDNFSNLSEDYQDNQNPKNRFKKKWWMNSLTNLKKKANINKKAHSLLHKSAAQKKNKRNSMRPKQKKSFWSNLFGKFSDFTSKMDSEEYDDDIYEYFYEYDDDKLNVENKFKKDYISSLDYEANTSINNKVFKKPKKRPPPMRKPRKKRKKKKKCQCQRRRKGKRAFSIVVDATKVYLQQVYQSIIKRIFFGKKLFRRG